MAKRERSINWEQEENRLLMDVIKPFLKTVENKNISTNTNTCKIKAWLEITDQFNRANKRVRDRKQLMNQWKVIKLNSKMEISIYRRETMRTGGGPRPPSPSPEILEDSNPGPLAWEARLLTSTPNRPSHHNEFDCDGKMELPKDDDPFSMVGAHYINEKDSIECSTTMPSTSQPVDKSVNIIDEPTGSVSHATPSIGHPQPTTKTPRHSTKSRKSSEKIFNFSETSFEDMHKFRILENDRQQKEYDLRMKTMAEMHIQVMKNLKLQEEILKKQSHKSFLNM